MAQSGENSGIALTTTGQPSGSPGVVLQSLGAFVCNSSSLAYSAPTAVLGPRQAQRSSSWGQFAVSFGRDLRYHSPDWQNDYEAPLDPQIRSVQWAF